VLELYEEFIKLMQRKRNKMYL